MTRLSFWLLLAACACAAFGSTVFAQDQGADQVFPLLRDRTAAKQGLAEQEQAAPKWRPQLEPGTTELSLSLGALGLSTTLLSHEQIIYKYTTEYTYWGDVELTGQTAFNPVLRMGYQVKRWLALEAATGMSFSEYTASVTNRHSRKNEEGAPVDEVEPALGDYDLEERSLITLQTGLNAVMYPLALHGDGQGRWHPYLTAGVGRIWYDMNSNYNDGAVGSFDLNAGGGLRLLGDRNVSIRAEVLMHRNTLQWDPAQYFMELNEGTTLVPLNEYPVQTDGSFLERPVTSFSSLDMNSLNFSIGVQGTF